MRLGSASTIVPRGKSKNLTHIEPNNYLPINVNPRHPVMYASVGTNIRKTHRPPFSFFWFVSWSTIHDNGLRDFYDLYTLSGAY
jgi:hypothetical protein